MFDFGTTASGHEQNASAILTRLGSPFYSCRGASIGSVFAACRVGRKEANPAAML